MKYVAVSFVAMLALTSCDAPGRPAAATMPVRPAEVTDFNLLYSQNCSGCHGSDGRGALSVGIGTPVYLAIASDTTIRKVTEQGRPGTAMPAFAQKAGGLLTDAQIEILVHGIRNWAKPSVLDTDKLPAYTASQPGDAARGQNIFATSCSGCHSQDGRGERPLVDSSYLALVTDQHLRTVTIAGLPHLGMPDWRGYRPPLSDADVTDVVAWLAAQRESLSLQLTRRGASE